MKTPNYRQQVGRRRLAVVCAMLGLALFSGVVGVLTHPQPAQVAADNNGPFSYFPSE